MSDLRLGHIVMAMLGAGLPSGLSIAEIRTRLDGVPGGRPRQARLRRGLHRLIALGIVRWTEPLNYALTPGFAVDSVLAERVAEEPPHPAAKDPNAGDEPAPRSGRRHPHVLDRPQKDGAPGRLRLESLNRIEVHLGRRRNGYFNAACDQVDKLAEEGWSAAQKSEALALEAVAMREAAEMIDGRVAAAKSSGNAAAEAPAR